MNQARLGDRSRFIARQSAESVTETCLASHVPYTVLSRSGRDSSVDLKRLPAAFYATAAGREPVREWLNGMDSIDRRVIGEAIATAEFGWPVGMPVCRSLGRGLYEIRSDLRSNRIARVIFCITDGRMVLLHGFIKKARKTPQAELELAMERKKEVTS